MSHLHETDHLFFEKTGLDRNRIEKLVSDGLTGAEDGELYLEYAQSESVFWDDGKLKGANFDTSQGFGLRSVSGEAFGYAHSAEMTEDAIRRAISTVQAVHSGHSGTMALPPRGTNQQLYTADNPVALVPFETKVKLMGDIDAYARGKDPRVRQVTASLVGSWKAVQILRSGGARTADIRPLVRLNVSVVLEQDGRMESGGHGEGGRVTFDAYLQPERWQAAVDEAIRQAAVNLEARPAPAGEMVVVLGAGWPGILLHEAVGHGLEGDFNRKGTSTFTGRIGERVASPGVTVVDDGTIPDRRGSLTIDDEGTPTQRNVLIEDGILKGYMQDRMNARLMGVEPTGNGRRESFEYHPMPRMTNTIMLGGNHAPEEILSSVKKGIYAVTFEGGQVDITSGKFVFSASEAYLIENGKIGPAVKGATLIGNGPDVMQKITMIGNDMQMDPGIGTCGKDGQGVPVGVGQPTLRIDGITVGGTET